MTGGQNIGSIFHVYEIRGLAEAEARLKRYEQRLARVAQMERGMGGAGGRMAGGTNGSAGIHRWGTGTQPHGWPRNWSAAGRRCPVKQGSGQSRVGCQQP
jgi:hypothetical protein